MREIVFAGFGGQGVLTAGLIVSQIALYKGFHATWMPAYGAAQRGGTANCSVILSDERIGSPVVEAPTEVIAMNRPSLTKFEPSVVPGGTVFVNSSIVIDKVQRTDVKAVYVPCDAIAADLGNPKVGNMVMLGAYIGATKALKVETVENMIQEMFTGKKAKLVPLNLEALHRGIACAE